MMPAFDNIISVARLVANTRSLTNRGRDKFEASWEVRYDVFVLIIIQGDHLVSEVPRMGLSQALRNAQNMCDILGLKSWHVHFCQHGADAETWDNFCGMQSCSRS